MRVVLLVGALLAVSASAAVWKPGPVTKTTACAYQAGGALPDRACTPGALNPAVTQRTILKTICVPGWTATVRPPASVTRPEKAASMRAYAATLPPSAYEYDHLIPLELGGAPNAIGNLWPEPRALPDGAAEKDAVENRLHARVCAGTLPLWLARARMATDWRKPFLRVR